MTTPESTLVTAQRLTDALNGMTRRLEEVQKASEERDEALSTYGRRNRILIIAAIIGFLLDVIATSVAFVAYVDTRDALSRVERNGATLTQIHQSNVSACETGNARAVKQKQALDAILVAGPARPGETKTQRQAVKALLDRDRALVAQGWKPRNCQQIYELRR